MKVSAESASANVAGEFYQRKVKYVVKHFLVMFFSKQKLISAIEKTIKLLDQSEDSDWSNLSVVEIKEILKNELEKIKSNQNFDTLELSVLFAPTSNIQETAMTNGWSFEYFEIAKVIDKFTA